MTFGQNLNSIISALGSFGTSGTDIQGSKELMNHQSDLWRSNTQWYNENAYKFMRQGLINADYNPILALGSSPLSGAMSSAVGSSGMNVDVASGTQANTARKVADSTISVNKATANKLAEEAMTQSNVRNNLDSQALLNMLSSKRIQKLLPFEMQKNIAEIAVLGSTANMNNVTAKWIPYNAETSRISADASKTTSETYKKWKGVETVGGVVNNFIGNLIPWSKSNTASIYKGNYESPRFYGGSDKNIPDWL